MARKRLAIEMGMGTDLHGMDYTKAAIRGLKDALWHNSLSVATALGYDREQMEVEIEVGVADPDSIDKAAVAAVLPYGKATVKPVKGGLDIPNDERSNTTVIASVAVIVYLDVEVADDSASDQAGA